MVGSGMLSGPRRGERWCAGGRGPGRLGQPRAAAGTGLFCSVVLLDGSSWHVSPPCPQPFHALELL